MIGRVYTRKSDRRRWRVVATTGEAWVLTPADEFGPNQAFAARELAKQFQRATDAPVPPPAPTYDDDTAGWKQLGANARLAAMAAAAQAGDLQTGDYLPDPQTTADLEPLTKEAVARLRRIGRNPRQPSPEDVFAEQQRDAIGTAAARITGSESLLASYEVGELQCSPAVAAVVDRWISHRNRERDRQASPNAHVFDRGAR